MNVRIKMKQEKKEILYGFALLILCALAFVSAANKQHNSWENDKNSFMMTAIFGRTDGLHIGDMVRISGIKVGKVVDATLQDDYHVKISMLLDRDYEIPADSSVSIESDSIMGQKFMDITLGGDDEIIPNGGSIIYTQDAMVMEELLDLVISYANSKKNPDTVKNTGKE